MKSVRVFLLCLFLLCHAGVAAEFNFVSCSVTDALRQIAFSGGINLIIGSGVSGIVDMILPDADPYEALRLLCDSRGLYLSESGGIFLVSARPPESEKRLVKLNNPNAAIVSGLIERMYPGVSSMELDSYRVWLSVPAGVTLEGLDALLCEMDRPERDVTVQLRLDKCIAHQSGKKTEQSTVFLRLLEGREGQIAFGREEIVEIWPFIITEWTGHGLRVSTGRINGGHVPV
ncbi:MAG: hypothetical protein PHQ23_00890, partial [Candidatus Wallbacteria bacterium]|nr:hypothetical protein [Candidatus Wallbacteria bacterium]